MNKEWEKLEKLPVWQSTKVISKKEAILEAQKETKNSDRLCEWRWLPPLIHSCDRSIAHVCTQTDFDFVAPAPVDKCVAFWPDATFAVTPVAAPMTYVAPAPSPEGPSRWKRHLAKPERVPAVTLAAQAPVIEFVAPASVVTGIKPTPVIKYAAFAPAPMIEDVTPALAVTYATPVPVIEYVSPSPVIENIAQVPTVTFAMPSQQLLPAYTKQPSSVASKVW